MSRIQILKAVQLLLPNKCAVCGSSGLQEGRDFIDFSFTLDGYGCVYICVPCYTHGMVTLKFHTTEEYTKLRDKYVNLLKDWEKIKDENGRLRSILGNVNFLRDIADDDTIPDHEIVPDVDSDDENESESSESDSKSGSADISDDDTSDDDSTNSDSGFVIKL